MPTQHPAAIIRHWVGWPAPPAWIEARQRKFAVLCPDRGGFEARRRPPDELPPAFRAYRIFTQDGTELTEQLYAGAVANRDMFTGQMPWQGSLFELHRAIDCLTALPEVDSGRVGVIGHSAGGQLAALLMYTDPRVRAGCSSCESWLFRWL